MATAPDAVKLVKAEPTTAVGGSPVVAGGPRRVAGGVPVIAGGLRVIAAGARRVAGGPLVATGGPLVATGGVPVIAGGLRLMTGGTAVVFVAPQTRGFGTVAAAGAEGPFAEIAAVSTQKAPRSAHDRQTSPIAAKTVASALKSPTAVVDALAVTQTRAAGKIVTPPTSRRCAMGIVPDTQQGSIDFFADRLSTWALNAAALGLSAGQVSDIATEVSDAQTKLAAAHAARIASKNATLDLANTLAAMRSLGGEIVKAIRNQAEITGDPNIYILGDIPPVAPPTPLGKPLAPTEVAASIDTNGYGVVTWRGTRAGGTAFVVERQMTALDGTVGPWAYAGTTTTEDFADNAIPTGFKAVTYRVYATRPAGNSPVATANPIYFGIAEGATNAATGTTNLTIAA